MTQKTRLLTCVAVVGFLLGGDLLACGDKFLVAGRGTRYQRPKNARAASILIYANPSSDLPTVLRKLRVENALKQEGHRSATVASFEQLSTILQSGRFDVVLASGDDAATVEQLLGEAPDAAVVLTVSPRQRSVLEAIDKAVERRDRNIRRTARS